MEYIRYKATASISQSDIIDTSPEKLRELLTEQLIQEFAEAVVNKKAITRSINIETGSEDFTLDVYVLTPEELRELIHEKVREDIKRKGFM